MKIVFFSKMATYFLEDRTSMRKMMEHKLHRVLVNFIDVA
jgi:predicted aldo/keto reductase-like oxidoreductase